MMDGRYRLEAPAALADGEPPLDRERLYRGEMLVFRRMAAMAALVARAQAMAGAAFAPAAPPRAEESFAPAEFLARAAALRRSFMRDAEVRAALRAVIAALGLDPASTYADRLILACSRAAPRTAAGGCGTCRRTAIRGAPTSWRRSTCGVRYFPSTPAPRW